MADPNARHTARSARRVRWSPWTSGWAGALLLALSAFLAGDVAEDLAAGVGPGHMITELAAFGVAIVGILGTAANARRALRHTRALDGDLAGMRAALERSRSEAEALRRRVGEAIDGYFASWALTAAERDIALLILRGLSLKEIAGDRGTTERTVRHQALAIYRKAGVSGRAEMAAFFLQDMLAPALAPPSSAAAPEPDGTAWSGPLGAGDGGL